MNFNKKQFGVGAFKSGELRITSDSPKKLVEIFTLPEQEDTESGMVRIYKKSQDDEFIFQIRANQKINNKGESKNMIAQFSFTSEDLKNMYQFVEEEKKKGLIAKGIND